MMPLIGSRIRSFDWYQNRTATLRYYSTLNTPHLKAWYYVKLVAARPILSATIMTVQRILAIAIFAEVTENECSNERHPLSLIESRIRVFDCYQHQ